MTRQTRTCGYGSDAEVWWLQGMGTVNQTQASESAQDQSFLQSAYNINQTRVNTSE